MRHGIPFLKAPGRRAAGFGFLVAVAGCGAGEPPRTSPQTVTSVPSARLSALDGSTTDLGALVRGHPALVTLWATWCEACVGETKALNQLEERSRPDGGALVVAVAVGESRETVGTFAQTHRLGYSLFVDEDFRVADALGERRVPTTLVVDRHGRIVFRGGALDRAGLTALRQVLAEK